jgi:rubrerythrin
MDHYPTVNLSEGGSASSRDSNTSANREIIDAKAPLVAARRTTFPIPAGQQLPRNDSSNSTSTVDSQAIDSEYAQYTDAPPPFEEEQYEGKSEEEQSRMRRLDYAKELNRMMGRQLVKGLKSDVKSPSGME